MFIVDNISGSTNWTNEERELYESIEEKRKLTVEVLRTKFEEGEQIGMEKGRELERQRVEKKNRKNTIRTIQGMLKLNIDNQDIKNIIHFNKQYDNSDLENMINSAKEEIGQPETKKIRHG